MLRRVLAVLAIANIGIGSLALSGATVRSDNLAPRGIHDCCAEQNFAAYCCDDCCWFFSNCSNDADCN